MWEWWSGETRETGSSWRTREAVRMTSNAEERGEVKIRSWRALNALVVVLKVSQSGITMLTRKKIINIFWALIAIRNVVWAKLTYCCWLIEKRRIVTFLTLVIH